MTTHFLMIDDTDRCRYYACVRGWVRSHNGGNTYITEPCHWCGGTGRQSMRIEQGRENAK